VKTRTIAVRHVVVGASLVAAGLLAAACSNAPYVDPVPVELANVEGAAEGAVEAAISNDVPGLQMQMQLIMQGWTAYRPSAVTAGAAASLLTRLDNAIAAMQTSIQAADKTPLSMGRASNAVTQPMAELFEIYHPAIPGNVITLDYLGRELRLDALAGDFTRAKTDLDSCKARFEEIRADLLKTPDASLAARMDSDLAAIAAAQAAKNAANLTAAALLELETVDKLESAFTRAVEASD
jgi:hypothetical protein